jgi:hypothetical protein
VPLPPALRVAYAAGGEAMAIRAATALRGPGAAVACDLEPSDAPPRGADLFVEADGCARWWDGERWADASTAEAVAALAGNGSAGGRTADERALPAGRPGGGPG